MIGKIVSPKPAVPSLKNGKFGRLSFKRSMFYQDEFHIVLYMIHLLQTGKTFSVVRMSYFDINYFHSIVVYQNPSACNFI